MLSFFHRTKGLELRRRVRPSKAMVEAKKQSGGLFLAVRENEILCPHQVEGEHMLSFFHRTKGLELRRRVRPSKAMVEARRGCLIR